MRLFLLIIATIVGVTYGYGYAFVLWIACRIVVSVISKGTESSARSQTYSSHHYQSSYQSDYQQGYQHNNVSGNQTTESKGMEYCYSVLDVSSNATDAEVIKAYRKLAMECHPDRCANSSEESSKRAYSACYRYTLSIIFC